jgi:hypothetical protein
MGVLREWACKAHGPFEESTEQGEVPSCPRGCSRRFVTREIRTAPAVRSAVMGTIDKQTRGLAHDFGLSDIKVGRDDGKSVMDNLRKAGKPDEFAPQWLPVPHMKPGWVGRGEKPAALNPAAFGVQPGNIFNEIGEAPKWGTPEQRRVIATNVVASDTTNLATVKT